MKKLLVICWLVLLFMGVVSCNKHPHHTITPAFYFWKQAVKLSDTEKQHLQHLAVKKLYVKFFDVDRDVNGAIKPVAVAAIDTLPAGLEIVPVVFITNRSFFPDVLLPADTLAELVAAKIKRLAATQQIEIKECQLDCDWSAKTKENYFLFLQSIRKQLPNIRLSATIRLHQVKYFMSTGVPPVDKGLLMFYNMTDVRNIDTENSILNYHEAKKYLDKLGTYPLPLDIGLPVFSWGVVFHNNKFNGFMPGLATNDLTDTSYFEALGKNKFKAKRTNQKYPYLYQDDIVRWEAAQTDELAKSVAFLKHKLTGDTLTVTLFHLDEQQLKQYAQDELQALFTDFN